MCLSGSLAAWSQAAKIYKPLNLQTPCAAKTSPSVDVFFRIQSTCNAFICPFKIPSFKYVINLETVPSNNVQPLMVHCSH